MAETQIAFVTYNPPAPGLPYLAVAIFPDGDVSAVPYKTAAEAENHVWQGAQYAANLMSKGEDT